MKNELLEKIYQQENLNREEMNELSQLIFSGQLTDSQIGALFIGMKMKGETGEELAGLAEVMKQVAVDIPYRGQDAMCNCGTGGDRSFSFNISTTAAFVLAAGGIKVAKTGNRSISSKSGSFDLCEVLGIDFMKSPTSLAALLDEVGIAFIFAPLVHPNMKYVNKVRSELGTPTIMNLVGPIANPANLEYQLMGCFRRDLVDVIAGTLGMLGRKKAVVVNGAGYMDEASLAGENHYALYEDGQVSHHILLPEDVNLPTYPIEAIRGGDPKRNAEIFYSVLRDQESSPYYDTVLLNAGLGLFAGNKAADIASGVELANHLISSGQAFAKFEELLEKQKKVA